MRKIGVRPAGGVKPRRAGGFYDRPEWKAARLAVLRRDHWRCVICGISVARPGQARVDHIKTLRTHPQLALYLPNLRTLCTICDAQSHGERRIGGNTRQERFTAFDATGTPRDPNHHWNNVDLGASHPQWLNPSRIPLTIVCGAPGSGKSTYVEEHKAQPDLVIDLDVIGSKLSGLPLHSWGSEWLDAAIRIRNQHLAALSRATPPWPAAWFIVGEPTAHRRQWWADKLKPQAIVLMQTDMSLCLNRRSTKAHVIRQWFNLYSPRIDDQIVSGQDQGGEVENPDPREV